MHKGVVMRERIGFTVLKNRISPLFDVAENFLVMDYEEGSVQQERVVHIGSMEFFERIRDVISLGMDVLICGAISRQYFAALMFHGLDVIPFISGEVEKIKRAYIVGELERKSYIMPGCFKHRKNILRRWKMQGRGSGRGRGMGGAGRGMGGGGRMQGKVDGICVCPKCGYKEDHLRGFPCFEKMCPNCKTPLQRG